jgi:hypothetical protein
MCVVSQEAVRVLEAYHAAHPGVVNLPKLVKRVRREVDFVTQQLQATQQQAEGQYHQQQEQEEQEQEQQPAGEVLTGEEDTDHQQLLQGRLQVRPGTV